MVRLNFSPAVNAIRVLAGDTTRASNKKIIAKDGRPIYDRYRSLGLIGMPSDLKWAHVVGPSMTPLGIEDNSFIAYKDIDDPESFMPTKGDVLLLEIVGENKSPNLHGGYKLREFVSLCTDKPGFFNEISYKENRAVCNVAKLSLVRGIVQFQ